MINSNSSKPILPIAVVGFIEKRQKEVGLTRAIEETVLEFPNSEDLIYQTYSTQTAETNVERAKTTLRISIYKKPAIVAIGLVLLVIVVSLLVISNQKTNSSALQEPPKNLAERGPQGTSENGDSQKQFQLAENERAMRKEELREMVETSGGQYRVSGEGSILLTFRHIDDAALAPILTICRELDVMSFDLSESSISDESVKTIASMDGVEYVYLQQTGVTSKGVQSLKNLKLTELQFHDTAVGDDGLESLPNSLTGLMIYNTAVTDEGMHHLAELTNLRNLFLGGNPIGDAGVRDFRHLNLQWLDLTQTNITDDSFEYFPASLTKLELDSTGITDAGLAKIGRLNGLKELKLSNTSISDEGVKHLVRLDGLNKLEIRNCANVTDVSIEMLKTRFPNIEIEF